jgi:hypothetical protein
MLALPDDAWHEQVAQAADIPPDVGGLLIEWDDGNGMYLMSRVSPFSAVYLRHGVSRRTTDEEKPLTRKQWRESNS